LSYKGLSHGTYSAANPAENGLPGPRIADFIKETKLFEEIFTYIWAPQTSEYD
jgi:hypothetical protein